MLSKPRLSRLAAAIFVLSSIPAVSQASSSVKLHGLIDAYVGSVKYSGEPGRINSVGNGGLTSSWWDLSGEEKINDNLTAVFDLEAFFQVNTGEGGRPRPNDSFFSRQSSVGLKGSWGTIRLGRNTAPNFLPTLFFNALGNSFSFSPLFLHSYTPTRGQTGLAWKNSIEGDTGWSNSVMYQTPFIKGFTASVYYQFSADESHKKNIGANIIYRNGPFAASVYGQRVQLNNPAGVTLPGPITRQTTWFGGLSYDFKWVKLFASYQQASHNTKLRDKTYQLGVTAPAGGGKFMLSWARTNRNTGSERLHRQTITGGYDYHLSKRTDVYALLMSDKISSASRASSVAVGIRHSF